ncbi:hypothetical protein HZ993_15545 [Rhodoferax sp. AJA081-3]|uniref:hypothetical protein n=1 Tax=Rhodoferax sp. AJA081-3 TaxID=2752316 RepID=UPI001ADF2F25|nr:hypothetical protein [Rhodoferax sp. AJA081-3]QTN26722.1 hypothetical protein HZ993_15545 [Rhodoferax sp. AJA081-3]
MDFLTLSILAAIVAYYFQRRDEHRRILLLGTHLGQYQIEKLMETLTEGYMRALGEPNPERQQQIWSMLTTTETALAEQFRRFVADFSRLDAETTRASKLPLSIFYTRRWLPGTTFDFRQALAVHAQGICRVIERDGQQSISPKDKAFTLLAELFLMQHSCHWFCKSKTVASTRLVLRHQTPYEKVLESVAPATLQAYNALVAA